MQIYTGAHPFDLSDESKFRKQVLNGEIDWSPIEEDQIVYELLANSLCVNPADRWSSKQILEYLQSFIVIELQRVYRGSIQLLRQSKKRI